jgi:hypothetical protein
MIWPGPDSPASPELAAPTALNATRDAALKRVARLGFTCAVAVVCRSRDFAGPGGRASGGWLVGSLVSVIAEFCECCTGHGIGPGELVHLVETRDGSVLTVCAECVGVRPTA